MKVYSNVMTELKNVFLFISPGDLAIANFLYSNEYVYYHVKKY